MTVVEYRKVRCDNPSCKKEIEIKREMGFSLPMKWIDINIIEGKGSSGTVVYSGEFCSRTCALVVMHSLIDIPRDIVRI